MENKGKQTLEMNPIASLPGQGFGFSVGSGDLLTIDFEIIDASLARYPASIRGNSRAGAGYTVTITKGSRQLDPLFTTHLTAPGKHRAVIMPFPAPQACTLHLTVTSLDLGLYAEEHCLS